MLTEREAGQARELIRDWAVAGLPEQASLFEVGLARLLSQRLDRAEVSRIMIAARTWVRLLPRMSSEAAAHTWNELCSLIVSSTARRDIAANRAAMHA